MTTITIRNGTLERTEFQDPADLLAYLSEQEAGDAGPVEFGPLAEDEVTPEMRAKMKEVKQLSKTHPERFMDIR